MGADTLFRIVEAGIEVFSQDGPSAAGTLEIAVKAGVAESTVFRRFGSKENFFHECVRTSLGRSLAPSHFRALIYSEGEDAEHGFRDSVLAAVKRWYVSLPVTAARLALFTALSSSRRWRNVGGERINEIITILMERVDQERRKRHAPKVDERTAATTLITNLLYRKSTKAASDERNLAIAETCIRQWIFGLFQEPV